MAKKKKAAEKSIKVKRTVVVSDMTEPFNLIFELTLKDKEGNPLGKQTHTIPGKFGLHNECPDNKFTYSFDKTNAAINKLVVEKFNSGDNPAVSGDFTSCIDDLSNPPKIRVTTFATKTADVQSFASLTLKFNGKDVYSPTRILDDQGNGMLGFSELVNLPL